MTQSEQPAPKTEKRITEQNNDSQKTILIDRTKTTHRSSSYDEPKAITIKPGSTLNNRFDIIEVIGSGGMGTVYKALDKRDIEAGNGRFIAIKVLNDESKDNADLLQALYEETRNTQSLSHPNIVTVYDYDRDANLSYMTMEFIEGAPLDKILKKNPYGISIPEAINIITQIGSALSYAHTKHIIHLDLKPNNIFFDRNESIKILDFGIAQRLNSSLANNDEAYTPFAITPRYASIELLRDQTPSTSDDIYAFACVCYEILTGKHPFHNKTADIALKDHLIPEKIKLLSSQQWKALKKALSLQKSDRTKSIDQFLIEFNSKSTNKNYIISGVGLVALLFPLGYYYLLPKNTEQSPTTPTKEISIIKPSVNKPPVKTQANIATERVSLPKKESQPVPPINPPFPEIYQGKIKVKTDKKRYQIGDTLTINFETDKPAYVQLFLVTSAGEVSSLYPNPYQMDNPLQPNKTYQIPPTSADFTLDVSAPTGEDTIYALVNPQPFLTNTFPKNKTIESYTQSQITYQVY